MAGFNDLFGLVRRAPTDGDGVDEGVLIAFRQAYPGRRVDGGGGFVFVHPCATCKHTKCGPECGCECTRATVRP